MQILRNSEYYASGKQQGFSYHGYSNRLVFNISNRAECFSDLKDNYEILRYFDFLSINVQSIIHPTT